MGQTASMRLRTEPVMSIPSNAAAAIERVRSRILVRGAVQGVGFRPFVHRQATALGLAGWVINSNAGGRGRGRRRSRADRCAGAQNPRSAASQFYRRSRRDMRNPSALGSMGSRSGQAMRPARRTAQVLPDFATCADCLAELFDPTDRRYRYPFINCTHCGPRYSIIEDIPYDRARTSMRRLCDVSGLPSGIRQSGRPALSRRAQCLCRLRPAYCAVERIWSDALPR